MANPRMDVPNIDAPLTATQIIERYFSANVELAFYKAAIVPVTQPLQAILRCQQAALRTHKQVFSVQQAAVSIKQGGGISAFYKGTIPASLKEAAKNGAYKGIVLTETPGLVGRFIEEKTHPNLHALACGGIAAGAEVAFGGPLESLATFRVTSQGKDRDAKFLPGFDLKQKTFAQNLKTVMASLYRGSAANYFKTCVASTTFFAVKKPIARSVDRAYDLSEGQPRPLTAKFLAAALTGAAVAATSTPFDVIKTWQQMPNPAGEGLWRMLAVNYAANGVRGVSAGLSIKILQVIFGWSINTAVVDSILTKNHVHTHFKKPQAVAATTSIEPSSIFFPRK